MPRQSAAHLSIVPLAGSPKRPKLIPLGSLSKPERRVFDHLVRTNGHLRQADIPMLQLLCAAYCRAMSKKPGGDDWERANRIVLALARSLRLTVQATIEPRTVARQRALAELDRGRNPWDRHDPDDRT